MHFGADGGLHIFDVGGYIGSLFDGKWRVIRVSGKDFLLQEGTFYRVNIDGKVVHSDKRKIYRVFVRLDGNVSLDEIVDGKFKGITTVYSDARNGFPREAEFKAARKNVVEGRSPLPQPEKPSAGTMIGQGILFIALCGGTAGILCPM